jgi:DNA-directed RNA polymerase specialized sigma24 family protein
MTFPDTNWAVVRKLDAADAKERDWALSRLVEEYSAPLLAFARWEFRDKQPQDHEDMLQSFFLKCLRTGGLARADESKGRFRNYLASGFRRFGDNWVRDEGAKKRMPVGGLTSTTELLERYGDMLEPRDGEGAEGALQRVYLKQVLERSLMELRNANHKRPERYAAFVAWYLVPARDGYRPDLDSLAATTRFPDGESCMKVLKSVWKQFVEIAVAQLAKDCGDDADPSADWAILSSSLLAS